MSGKSFRDAPQRGAFSSAPSPLAIASRATPVPGRRRIPLVSR